MKFTRSFLAIVAAGLFFTSCKQAESAPKEEVATVALTEKSAPVKPETASFSIEGMSCAIGCAKTIEKELSQMEGVQKATVDFDKKTAVIEFDATKQTPENFVKVVEKTADGKTYKVSNVSTSGNQAMVFIEKEKKNKKKNAKAAKDGKPACCAAKKSCSEGKA